MQIIPHIRVKTPHGIECLRDKHIRCVYWYYGPGSSGVFGKDVFHATYDYARDGFICAQFGFIPRSETQYVGKIIEREDSLY